MAKFTTLFQQPAFFPGFPFHLGILIDGSMAGPLYFERRYLDINRAHLETVTTLIPADLFGNVLHLSIQDPVLLAARFIEVSIDSVNNAQAGTGERWAAPAVAVDTLPRFATMNRDAVKWEGYPLHLGILVDATLAGTALYFERRYLDINRGLLEIKSTLIPEESYGTYLQLAIPDEALPCAVFVEASITSENNAFAGYCPGDTAPEGIFDDTFDLTYE